MKFINKRDKILELSTNWDRQYKNSKYQPHLDVR